MQDLVSWIIPSVLEWNTDVPNYSCTIKLYKTLQIFGMPDYFVQLQIDYKVINATSLQQV